MAADAFEAVDPKLTIYALANGMDLLKDPPGERCLHWYRDGRERGVVITVEPDGSLSLAAAAWMIRAPEGRETHPVRSGVRPAEMSDRLSDTLAEVVDAANRL